MAENKPPPPLSSSKPPPTIALPPRTSIQTMFADGPGASPGPMTLVSSFFAENEPEHDFQSFSQLLAGAMSSPSTADGGGSRDFRSQLGRPAGLAVSQPPGVFTIPPGLSPAGLLDSPGLFPLPQGPMSYQQILSQLSGQAQVQMQILSEYPSFSAAASAPSMSQLHSLPSTASLHQQQRQPCSNDQKIMDVSLPDQKPQPPPNLVVDKPSDDGYNWRKYGQKQVKGSEFPRSYYKCTYSSCPVKKKVERSLDGQITEIIYKGQHNHPPPSKRARDAGNANDAMNAQGSHEFGSHAENLNKSKEGTSYLSSGKDQESSHVTPEHMSGSSDSEEVGNAETRVDNRDEDEPESKRRNVEVQAPEQASNHRTVTEPRIIVQTPSEVDLLDDGYRWRKYGQKVVKGNPYPRSYYKCTNPGCNVRKHVERAASDPKAVITTYEGKHNHDVPAAKNSSHVNAIASSQLRPSNSIVQQPTASRPTASRPEFGSNKQQPAALLRFKEEQIT